jgi:hypothetical protein
MGKPADDHPPVWLLRLEVHPVRWLPFVTVPQILILAMLLNKFANRDRSHL